MSDFCTVIRGFLISMIVLILLLNPVNTLSQTGLIEPTPASSLVVDDSSKVFILRSLADQGDVSALNSLVNLASKDNQEAALALYFLALWGNPTPTQLQTLNPQAFIDGANRGNIGSVLVLYSLALWGNPSAGEFMETLSPQAFIDRALEGDPEAVLVLRSMADWGNATAKVFLSDLDTQAFVDRALEGDPEAVFALNCFADWGNTTIREFLHDLDTHAFVERISPNNYKAILALNILANLGNQSAVNTTLDLISKGNREATNYSRYISNRIAINLRNAHLGELISDRELEIRLTELTFNDNPFILYACYTSRNNFGVLAPMIFNRLKSQADSKGKHIYSFLKELDSINAFYRDFILQLANFSQLQNILETPESLREVMDNLFKELPSATIESYGARLASFIYKITTNDNFIYQKEFQEYLRELYDQTDGLKRHFIAAVLIVYMDKFDFLDADDISTIGIRHGIDDAVTYIDYKQLFKNSRLLVHIVFADQDAVEGHYNAALRFFQGQDPTYPGIYSYKKVASMENQTVLEKGNIRIVT